MKNIPIQQIIQIKMIKKGKVPLSQAQMTENLKQSNRQQTNKTQTRYKSLTVKEYSIGQGRFQKPPGSQGTFGSGIFFSPQQTIQSGFNQQINNQSHQIHSIPHASKQDFNGQRRACESPHQQQIDIPPHPSKTIYKFDYNQFNLPMSYTKQPSKQPSPKSSKMFQISNQRVSKTRRIQKKMLKDEGTQPMSVMSMPSNISQNSNSVTNQIRVRIDKVMENQNQHVGEASQFSDPKTVINYPEAQHQQVRGSFEMAETELSALERQQVMAENQRVSNLQLDAQIDLNIKVDAGELKKIRNTKSAKTMVKAILNNKKSQGSICDANTPGGGGKNALMSPKFDNIEEVPWFSSQAKDKSRVNLDHQYSQQLSANKLQFEKSKAHSPQSQLKNVQLQQFQTIQPKEPQKQTSKSTATVRRNLRNNTQLSSELYENKVGKNNKVISTPNGIFHSKMTRSKINQTRVPMALRKQQKQHHVLLRHRHQSRDTIQKAQEIQVVKFEVENIYKPNIVRNEGTQVHVSQSNAKTNSDKYASLALNKDIQQEMQLNLDTLTSPVRNEKGSETNIESATGRGNPTRTGAGEIEVDDDYGASQQQTADANQISPEPSIVSPVMNNSNILIEKGISDQQPQIKQPIVNQSNTKINSGSKILLAEQESIFKPLSGLQQQVQASPFSSGKQQVRKSAQIELKTRIYEIDSIDGDHSEEINKGTNFNKSSSLNKQESQSPKANLDQIISGSLETDENKFKIKTQEIDTSNLNNKSGLENKLKHPKQSPSKTKSQVFNQKSKQALWTNQGSFTNKRQETQADRNDVRSSIYENTTANNACVDSAIQGQESLTKFNEFAIEIENTPKLGRQESSNLRMTMHVVSQPREDPNTQVSSHHLQMGKQQISNSKQKSTKILRGSSFNIKNKGFPVKSSNQPKLFHLPINHVLLNSKTDQKAEEFSPSHTGEESTVQNSNSQSKLHLNLRGSTKFLLNQKYQSMNRNGSNKVFGNNANMDTKENDTKETMNSPHWRQELMAKDSEPFLNFIQNIKIHHKNYNEKRNHSNLSGGGVKIIERIPNQSPQGLMSIKSNIIHGRNSKNIGVEILHFQDTVRGIQSPQQTILSQESRCKKRVNSISQKHQYKLQNDPNSEHHIAFQRPVSTTNRGGGGFFQMIVKDKKGRASRQYIGNHGPTVNPKSQGLKNYGLQKLYSNPLSTRTINMLSNTDVSMISTNINYASPAAKIKILQSKQQQIQNQVQKTQPEVQPLNILDTFQNDMISGSPQGVTYDAVSDDGIKTATVNANTIDGEEQSRSIYHNTENQSISNPKMRLCQQAKTSNYNFLQVITSKAEGNSVRSQGDLEYQAINANNQINLDLIDQQQKSQVSRAQASSRFGTTNHSFRDKIMLENSKILAKTGAATSNKKNSMDDSKTHVSPLRKQVYAQKKGSQSNINSNLMKRRSTSSQMAKQISKQPPTSESRDRNEVLQVKEIIKKQEIKKIDIAAIQSENTIENVETNQSPIKVCPSTSNLIQAGDPNDLDEMGSINQNKRYPLDLEKLKYPNYDGQIREISFRVMSNNSNELINQDLLFNNDIYTNDVSVKRSQEFAKQLRDSLESKDQQNIYVMASEIQVKRQEAKHQEITKNFPNLNQYLKQKPEVTAPRNTIGGYTIRKGNAQQDLVTMTELSNTSKQPQRAMSVSPQRMYQRKDHEHQQNLSRILDLNLRKISQIQALEELMKINNLKIEQNHGAEINLQEMLRLKKGSHMMSSPTKTTSNLLAQYQKEEKAQPLSKDRIKVQNQMDDLFLRKNPSLIKSPSKYAKRLRGNKDLLNDYQQIEGIRDGVHEYFSGLSLLSSLPEQALNDANLEQLTQQILVNKRFGPGLKGRVTIADRQFKNMPQQEFQIDQTSQTTVQNDEPSTQRF